jgi:hypothetical protein
MSWDLFGHKRKQRDNPSPLDSYRQDPLMFRTGTGNTPGQDLSPFRNETAKPIRVLVIYFFFLEAEFTDLFLKKDLSLSPAAGSVITLPAIQVYIRASLLPGRALCFRISFISHS